MKNTISFLCAVIGNGKRFMAYEIIRRLELEDATRLLYNLHLAVEAKDKERNKKHEVWEDSFDWKECRDNSFTWQKLDYIHNNPCRGKWNLVNDVTKYEHSSARFYFHGDQSAYSVMNFMELD